jgi:hypothetical protein
VASSPEAFGVFLDAQTAQWTEVIRSRGIRAE